MGEPIRHQSPGCVVAAREVHSLANRRRTGILVCTMSFLRSVPVVDTPSLSGALPDRNYQAASRAVDGRSLLRRGAGPWRASRIFWQAL